MLYNPGRRDSSLDHGLLWSSVLLLSIGLVMVYSASVAMAVTSRYPIVRDNQLNQYVTLVGLTLANSSNRPDANWLFAVVDTPEVNAFSGPDGYILLTRGLIRQRCRRRMADVVKRRQRVCAPLAVPAAGRAQSQRNLQLAGGFHPISPQSKEHLRKSG